MGVSSWINRKERVIVGLRFVGWCIDVDEKLQAEEQCRSIRKESQSDIFRW